MRHLGDITKLRGGEMPAVDVITGGSPCQDLSVAGARKGLAGERSGLFMEQIRIVKEMRDADRKRGRTGDSIRPRYLVWENVPGALSSNKGRDFQQVLTEIVRIAEPDAPEVPFPDKGGWPGWDVLMGDGWSVAWRIHDARFWGVPQRRRRICVLADFGGWTAGEILLDPVLRGTAPAGDSGEAVGGAGIRPGPEVHAVGAGLPGDIEPGGAPGEEAAGDAGSGAAEAGGVLNGWDVQSKRVFDPGGVCGTLNSGTTEGMNIVPSVLVSDTFPAIANALTARYDGSPQPDKGNGAPIVAYSIQGNTIDRDAKQNGLGLSRDVVHTLDAVDRHGVFAAAAELQCANPWDPQSERVYTGDGAYHSISANSGGGQNRDAILAFTQNQRNEVRDLGDAAGALSAEPGMKQQTYVCCGGFKHKASGTAGSIGFEPETSATLISCQECAVYDARGNGDDQTVCTLTGDHQDRVTDYTTVCVGNGQTNDISMKEISNTLDAGHDAQAVLTAVDCRNMTESAEVNGTLQAKSNGGFSLNLQNVCRQNSIVRRLTPLECTRLQGYPDGWVDIGEWTDSKGKRRKPADAPMYKALGNSIALPFWRWLARRIVAQYVGTVTIGSLFDGIGGFPLVFAQSGAVPVWASEVEEFCIAVTKRRFGDEDAGTAGDWRELAERGRTNG